MERLSYSIKPSLFASWGSGRLRGEVQQTPSVSYLLPEEDKD